MVPSSMRISAAPSATTTTSPSAMNARAIHPSGKPSASAIRGASAPLWLRPVTAPRLSATSTSTLRGPELGVGPEPRDRRGGRAGDRRRGRAGGAERLERFPVEELRGILGHVLGPLLGLRADPDRPTSGTRRRSRRGRRRGRGRVERDVHVDRERVLRRVVARRRTRRRLDVVRARPLDTARVVFVIGVGRARRCVGPRVGHLGDAHRRPRKPLTGCASSSRRPSSRQFGIALGEVVLDGLIDDVARASSAPTARRRRAGPADARRGE